MTKAGEADLLQGLPLTHAEVAIVTTPVTNASSEQRFGPEEVDRLWQRLLYEGTQHTNRVNFYIVAQSMFFAAFASNQRENFVFSGVCVVAGVLMSVIWMQMARDQDVIVQKTRVILREHCKEFAAFANIAPKRRITQRMLSVYLPVSMILLWLIAGCGDFFTQVVRLGSYAFG